MSDPTASLLNHYRENQFNPVLIPVERASVWEAHLAKRRNLYERHLGIPLALLRSRSVLEFGANSGENALVLALWGASLTLVEPNEQVLPRLRDLFARRGLADRLAALRNETIEEFHTSESFDLVIAEGFLYTLTNRDRMLCKIAGFLRPGGLGVVSFNDRFGGLLEQVRRMVLFRACRLAGVTDTQSADSLGLARQLFGADFARLNASRTFEAWWKDTLVNPFYGASYLWSFPDVLPLIAQSGCEFYSSSPLWASCQHFTWYKDLSQEGWQVETLLRNWRAEMPYFLTGLRPGAHAPEPASEEVIRALTALVDAISLCTESRTPGDGFPAYPTSLEAYLGGSADQRIREFNRQLKEVFLGLQSTRLDDILASYHKGQLLRTLWGTAYHYVCFRKGGDLPG